MNFEKVKEVIVNAANIDEDKIKLSASLAVELGMALEEEFGITIDEDKLASFKTVEDIVNFIDNAKED